MAVVGPPSLELHRRHGHLRLPLLLLLLLVVVVRCVRRAAGGRRRQQRDARRHVDHPFDPELGGPDAFLNVHHLLCAQAIGGKEETKGEGKARASGWRARARADAPTHLHPPPTHPAPPTCTATARLTSAWEPGSNPALSITPGAGEARRKRAFQPRMPGTVSRSALNACSSLMPACRGQRVCVRVCVCSGCCGLVGLGLGGGGGSGRRRHAPHPPPLAPPLPSHTLTPSRASVSSHTMRSASAYSCWGVSRPRVRVDCTRHALGGGEGASVCACISRGGRPRSSVRHANFTPPPTHPPTPTHAPG